MWRLFRFWRLAAQDLRLLWFALRHPDRPIWLIPSSIALMLWAIEPLNLALPVFGVIDEFLLVPMLLHTMLKMLPARIEDNFRTVRTV